MEDILGVRTDLPNRKELMLSGQRKAQEALLARKGWRWSLDGPAMQRAAATFRTAVIPRGACS
jgi:hypothetical protein